MNKHENTQIDDSISIKLIGQFKKVIDSRKDWITKHYPRGAKKNTYMILGIACTSNKVNVNSRVIINPELLADTLRTIPILEDHKQVTTARRGTILDSWTCDHPTHDVSKYVVFAGLINLSGAKDTVLTECSKMNFSIGYSASGTDLICPNCGNDSPLHISSKTKQIVCDACFKPILDDKINYVHGKHIRTGIEFDKQIMLTYNSKYVTLCNNRTAGKKVDASSPDTYLQAIYNPNVTEISMVLDASDSERAPLLASISIDNIYKYYDQLEKAELSDSSATNEELVELFNDSLIIHQEDEYTADDNLDGECNHQDQNSNAHGETMSVEVQNQLALDLIDEVKQLNERFPTLLDSTTKELVLRDAAVDILGSPELLKIISTSVDTQVYSEIDRLIEENTTLTETVNSLTSKVSELTDKSHQQTIVPEPAQPSSETTSDQTTDAVQTGDVSNQTTQEQTSTDAVQINTDEVADVDPVTSQQIDSVSTPVVTTTDSIQPVKREATVLKRRKKK